MAGLTQTNGFPLKWFKNQDFVRNLYECVICLDVVRDAVQVRGCGHQFCEACLNDVLKLQAKCPSCRIKISEEMVFLDKGTDRAIGKLEVNCPCDECDWTGTLSSLLDEHDKRCLFHVMECHHDGCNEQVIQKAYQVHLTECKYRTVVCKHCGDKHVHKDTLKHLDLCPCLPVGCQNKCSEKNIPRHKMKEHLETACANTVVKCQYLEFGCDYECQRNEMEKHLGERTKEHLDFLVKENLRMKVKHEKDIDELKKTYLKNQEDIDELKKKSQEDIDELKKKSREDIDELKKKNQEDIDELKKKHEKKMDELKQEIEVKNREVVDELKKEHEKKMDELKLEIDRKFARPLRGHVPKGTPPECKQQ